MIIKYSVMDFHLRQTLMLSSMRQRMHHIIGVQMRERKSSLLELICETKSNMYSNN